MIFYFSGTGNSRYVAEVLANKTDDQACSMIDAVREEKFDYTLAEGEILGLVMPVYYWGVPRLVHFFLSQLKLSYPGERPYTYLVFTCGGSSCAASRYVTNYLPVDLFASLVMPDNFVLMYDIIHPNDIKRKHEQLKKSLGMVVGNIRNRKKLRADPNIGIIGGLQSRIVYPIYVRGRKTEKFFTDDNCDGCGFCSSICPDQAIVMEEGRPRWQLPQCEHCLACIHRCPQRAIQYGAKTAKRGRYVHPYQRRLDRKQLNLPDDSDQDYLRF